jgi:hypothetical protein
MMTLRTVDRIACRDRLVKKIFFYSLPIRKTYEYH